MRGTAWEDGKVIVLWEGDILWECDNFIVDGIQLGVTCFEREAALRGFMKRAAQ